MTSAPFRRCSLRVCRLYVAQSVLVCGGLLASAVGFAQAPATTSAATAATLAEVTAIRDAFVARVKADGFSCPIPVPTILVEDVPSFGQYDEKANVLRTSEWTLLKPQEKTLFLQLAGPGATEAQARALFDVASHHWIFAHEVGHWWQACRKVTVEEHHPYAVEYSADRISLAYWREVDPSVVTTLMPVFQGVVDHMPNPVPPGEDVQAYFDKHYEELGPSPAYKWFQSRMNVAAYEEKPAPSFKTVLGETK